MEIKEDSLPCTRSQTNPIAGSQEFLTRAVQRTKFLKNQMPPKTNKPEFRSYRFQRARTPGIIEVLNENSYVMAEYNERTGSVHWQRMVLASQREQIEKWLEDHYPSA